MPQDFTQITIIHIIIVVNKFVELTGKKMKIARYFLDVDHSGQKKNILSIPKCSGST